VNAERVQSGKETEREKREKELFAQEEKKESYAERERAIRVNRKAAFGTHLSQYVCNTFIDLTTHS
jgi:hypothetical protein